MAETEVTSATKAPKARKPKAAVGSASEAVAPVSQVIESSVSAATQTPAIPPVIETLEAISPAVEGDPISDPAPVAERISEGLQDMATVASPTETTAKAQAMFGEFSGRVTTAFEKSTKLSEEMVDFAKGNVEAVIASAKVAAKVGETLGQEAADYGKKNFETATAAFKSFATVKSPTELFQLQSQYAKASFDSAVAEASKLSESMMKFAGEIAQPLSNRYALAAEKIKTATSL